MSRQEDPQAKWIRENYEDLLKEYQFKWIASNENGLIAHATDMGDVMTEAAEKGFINDKVIFTFIN